MPITSIDKDLEGLAMTVVAEFAVPLERIWDAYSDPRQIERFWGPPEWPATFTRHDMFAGGRSEYQMKGPDGEISGGYWEFLEVERPSRFVVRDGFANPDGSPNVELPGMEMEYRFESTEAGSRVTTVTRFASLEHLEQLIAMGMEEGMAAAMSQIDAVVADLQSFVADRATSAQILSDTQVRVSRVIRGDQTQVWEAHEKPELLKRWLLGPPGWTMPVCEVAVEPGETYRYEWESEADGERFGFVGELLEVDPPYRSVTTESMIGLEGTPVSNEMTLRAVEGGTLLSIVVTYPDAATRDMVLATGMTEGMESSYQRLEAML